MRQTKRLLALVLALVMTLSLTVLDTSAARTGGGKITITSDTALTGKVAYTEITIKNGADVMVGKNTDISGVKKINIENGQLSLNGKLATEALTIGENGAVQFGANSQLSASGKTEIYTDTPFTGADNDQFKPTGDVVAKTTAGAAEANKYSNTTTATVNENLTPSTDPTPTENAKTVTKLEITGMTGESTATSGKDTPLVGDTLKAVTTPAGANVTYQWSVDGVAVSGATSATYKVTTDDAGKAISVAITAKDAKTEIEPAAGMAGTPDVLLNIADYAQIALPTTTANGKTTVTPVLDAPYQGYQAHGAEKGANKAIYVLNKDTAGQPDDELTVANGDFTVEWYVGSVAKANKLSAEVGGGNALAITPDGNYRTKLLGKQLILVVKGTGNYGGSVQATLPAVKAGLANAAIKSEVTGAAIADNTPVVVGEKLTVALTPANATATYKWVYGTAATAATATTTLGTGASYTVKAADAGKQIACIVTASGNYTNAPAAAADLIPYTGVVDKATVSAVITNADAAAVGVALKASTTPASYANSVSYTWYEVNGAVATKVGDKATYTPTKAGTYRVKIAATATTFDLDDTEEDVIVAAKLTKVTIENVTAKAQNRTYSLVGDLLRATAFDGNTDVENSANYVWKSGSGNAEGHKYQSATKTDSNNANNAYYYELAGADVGKKITCEITGTAPYSGTYKTSAITCDYWDEADTDAINPSFDTDAPMVNQAITIDPDFNVGCTGESAYQWWTVSDDFDIEAAPHKGDVATNAEKLTWLQTNGKKATGEGATTATYTPVAADYGKLLVCVVTNEDYHGSQINVTNNTVAMDVVINLGQAKDAAITAITAANGKYTDYTASKTADNKTAYENAVNDADNAIAIYVAGGGAADATSLGNAYTTFKQNKAQVRLDALSIENPETLDGDQYTTAHIGDVGADKVKADLKAVIEALVAVELGAHDDDTNDWTVTIVDFTPTIADGDSKIAVGDTATYKVKVELDGAEIQDSDTTELTFTNLPADNNG